MQSACMKLLLLLLALWGLQNEDLAHANPCKHARAAN